jgi:hypothetical protein
MIIMSSPSLPIQLAQQPIDREISDALFGVLPDGWTGIQLEARKTVLGPGSESYRISMVSTQNKPGIASVSEELQDAIRKLFVLHKQYGTGMVLARYILEEGPNGWGLVSEFEYDDKKN